MAHFQPIELNNVTVFTTPFGVHVIIKTKTGKEFNKLGIKYNSFSHARKNYTSEKVLAAIELAERKLGAAQSTCTEIAANQR